jgi:hypothetical protein
MKTKAQTMGDRPHLELVTLEASALHILETGATKNEATLTHFVKRLMPPAQFISLTHYDTTLICIDLEALTAARVECGVLHFGSSSTPRQILKVKCAGSGVSKMCW